MIRINELAFFAYTITDVPRSRAFYEGLLGLTPAMQYEQGDTAWIEYELGNATLGIGKTGSDQWAPSRNGGSAAFEVDDFDAAIAHLREKGVTFYLEPGTSPVCRYAVIADPDGNSLLIHKRNAGNT